MLFKMEMKSWMLKFLVTMVMIYHTSIAKADNCCTYDLQTEVGKFEREAAVITSGEAVQSPSDDSCPRISLADCVNPEGSRKSRLEIQSVDVIYDARCQRRRRIGSSEAESCHQREDWSYIALDISYKIAFTNGSNFQGIMFGLRTKSGAVSLTVGSIEDPCHYMYLYNDTLGEVEASDQVFHYTGYIGLHPGAEYELTATLMCTTVSVKHSISVPRCDARNNAVLKKNDYFCNLSPANFVPSAVGVHKNLSAWWNVFPKDGPFTHFVIELWQEPNFIEEAKVYYNESKYNGTDWIMTHQFSQQPPGEYEVWIYGQPDTVCSEGLHWGSCTAARGTATVPVDTVSLQMTPTGPLMLPSTSSSKSGLQMTPTGPLMLPSTSSSKSEMPISKEFLLLVVILVGTLLVLACFPVIWFIKWFIKFRSPDDRGPMDDDLSTTPDFDRMTVTTAVSHPDYDFKPLNIPGRNEYSALLEEHDPLTPDEGYPETPPVNSYQTEPLNPWTFRQDSNVSSLSQSVSEDAGLGMDYVDTRTRPNGGFQFRSQPSDRTNHSKLVHGNGLHIPKETVI